MDSHTVTIISAICPICDGTVHFHDWEPGKCHWCGASLADYTASGLCAKGKAWEVAVNPLSGEPVMMEAS